MRLPDVNCTLKAGETSLSRHDWIVRVSAIDARVCNLRSSVAFLAMRTSCIGFARCNWPAIPSPQARERPIARLPG